MQQNRINKPVGNFVTIYNDDEGKLGSLKSSYSREEISVGPTNGENKLGPKFMEGISTINEMDD